MIEVQNLTKAYGRHMVVQGLNFKIRNGHIYGLLGSAGAGKTTVMNLITGCLAPTAGTVLINGYDLWAQSKEAKRQIGYLPARPPLFPEMTPAEYLSFVAEAKGVGEELLDRQVKEVLALMELSEVKDRLIRSLSVPECRRVGLAQTLLGTPDILVLDEPVAGLENWQVPAVHDLIRKMSERVTVLVSGQDPAELGAICDHIIVLSEGRVVADEDTAALQSRVRPSDSLRMTVKGDEAGILAALTAMEGVLGAAKLADLSDGVASYRVQVSSANDALKDNLFFAMAEHRYAVTAMEIDTLSSDDVLRALAGDGASPAVSASIDKEVQN